MRPFEVGQRVVYKGMLCIILCSLIDKGSTQFLVYSLYKEKEHDSGWWELKNDRYIFSLVKVYNADAERHIGKKVLWVWEKELTHEKSNKEEMIEELNKDIK